MLERLFATRKGAVAVGLAAAAVALVLLLVYVKQYRHNVSATAQTTQVLVARSLIQKGTPATSSARAFVRAAGRAKNTVSSAR
jgi:hypothetical protein